MYLGIEIGGTKLQLGVGAGSDTELLTLECRQIDPDGGRDGILTQLEQVGRELIDRHEVTGIGIGFGGPVDVEAGLVVISHQIDGWDNFPLVEWCRGQFDLPVQLGNDCDAAALAEARFGAGRGRRTVFYVTVGTGIGGGLVIDGRLHGGGRPAVAEIGHLQPGLDGAAGNVESMASGRGIEEFAHQTLSKLGSSPAAADLLGRCGDELSRLSAKIIGAAAGEGNQVARMAVNRAVRVLGWAIASVVTLVAPERIVIGGGVSLLGEELFFTPLRSETNRFVFGPLVDSFDILPAELGEEVVVHGALALAGDGAGKPSA